MSAVRDAARVVLTTLALRDFRNLARARPRAARVPACVVIGENGQGKTNLLEAIYYLHLLRSVRGARDRRRRALRRAGLSHRGARGRRRASRAVGAGSSGRASASA